GGESGRALGLERPAVTQLVGDALGVLVAGVEDRLVARQWGERLMLERKLGIAEPANVAGHRRRHVKAGLDRSPVHGPVELDADHLAASYVRGPALGRDLDDLRRPPPLSPHDTLVHAILAGQHPPFSS